MFRQATANDVERLFMKKLIIFFFLFVSSVAGLAQDVLVPPAAIDLGLFGADVRVLTLDTIGSAVEDTELGLYDAAGNLLDENDDIGGGVPHTLQSEVVVGNLTGGTYYAAVSAYNTTFGPADFAVSGGGVSGGVVLNYSDDLDLAGAGAASLEGADAAGGVAWFSFEIGGGGESHTLEIAALSNGTVSGGGIYRPGATATLEALPDPGYVFTGWSGDASGNDNPLTIVMDGDRTVGATFAQDVVITPTAIDLGILGDEISVLTLDTIGSAVEDTELGIYDAAGNLLDQNDDIGGGGAGNYQSRVVVQNLTTGTYYAAVSAYNTTFGPADFAVSGGGVSGGVVLNYSGGLDVDGVGAAPLDGADAAGGVAWFSFEIEIGGGGGGGGESHTLEIAALSNGTVSGGGTYRPGATATLEALPDPGYVFTGWSGDASGNDNPLTIVMDGDLTVGATFARAEIVVETTGDVNATLTYSITGGQVTIQDCNQTVSGVLVIPATLDGLPVTSIGDNAFWGCNQLVRVDIPGGVTSLGEEAFRSCSRLTYVRIPDSVTSMGAGAFWDCRELSRFNIPARVTSIAQFLFNGCSSLTSVTIPDGVNLIGTLAFGGCINLTRVVVPEGVTLIEDSVFAGCSGLTTVSLGQNVTSIGQRAFYQCSGLISIDLPEGLTTIGSGAFDFCISMESLTIPASVRSIGSSAFYNCRSLVSVTIPATVSSLGDQAFARCNALTDVHISEGITSLGSRIFYGCLALERVDIPESITSLGDGVFQDCVALTVVNLLGSAPSVGQFTFGFWGGQTPPGLERSAFVQPQHVDSFGGTGADWNGFTVGISAPSLTPPQLAISSSPTGLVFEVSSLTVGQAYDIETSSDLESWSPFRSIEGKEGAYSFNIARPAAAKRFYRVIEAGR